MNKDLLILLGVFLVLVWVVFAVPDGATVTAGANETKTAATAGNHSAYGGNINSVNLSGQSQTQRWQGYYGSASGNVTLQDASGNKLYNWVISTLQGEVYATRNNTPPTWSNLASSDVSPGNLDTAMGWSTTASDSATNTFTDNANSAFNSSGSSITASTRPRVMLYNYTGSGVWEEVLLNTGTNTTVNHLVFAAIIQSAGNNFKNGTSNYQLIVPEDNTDNTNPSTYYFYVELQ